VLVVIIAKAALEAEGKAEVEGTSAESRSRGKAGGDRKSADSRSARKPGTSSERSRQRRRPHGASALGFARFLLRGLVNVSHEWALICTTHNFRKLLANRRALAARCS